MAAVEKNVKRRKMKESLEVRRARGEISCAECRRHKLKCNKSIPCTTCVRKGCPEICPNGTLSPSQGARHSPDNDEARMEKLLQMSKRIQQLEDALHIAHSSVSQSPHPLLSQDLLRIKGIVENPMQIKTEDDASNEATIESHGTLTMLGRGMESYVGMDRIAIDNYVSGETMHLKVNPAVSLPAYYPCEAALLAPLYLPMQATQTQIEERLPTLERASALIEAYLENLSWLLRIVDREQIMEELIPQIYRRRRLAGTSSVDTTSTIDPHTLSLLLVVFALGAVADLTLSSWNEEANLYYHLAWTAIGLRPVFDGATLHTVQALALLGSYDTVSCRKNSLEGTWKIVSFCMSLACSIGLHRDPSHFNFPPKLVQRRRQVFWELHGSDVWRSIGSGRPMAFVPSAVDCELPEDRDAIISEDGRQLPSVWAIRYRYSKEVMADVVEKLCSVRALKYFDILSMDQKIRDFNPEQFANRTSNENRNQDGSPQSALIKFLLIWLKDATLLLVHRNFFIRALIENPMDPMRCQFAPSFLSTYRSATTVLRGLREVMKCGLDILVRIWPVWAHALSATVILGSIAACGTTSAFAPQAYLEFNLAIDMLTKVQMHPIVKDLLPVVLRLRDQAYQALARHGNADSVFRSPAVNRLTTQGNDKEFSTVSGLGRLLHRTPDNQSGSRHGLLSDMVDETSNRSVTPSSTVVTSRETPESVYGMREHFRQGRMQFSDSFESSFFNTSQESPAIGSFSRPAGPSAIATSSSPELFRPSPQSINASSALKHLRSESSDTNTPHLPPKLQMNFMQDTSWERPAESTHQIIYGQERNNFDGLKGGLAGPSDGLSRLPTSSNAGFEGYDADAPYSPLNFDTLATLSPTTLFNTDFDVSFNMRASTGNENILPLISDDSDLTAWRAILGDSRFFGNEDTASDRSGQPSLF